MKLQKPKGTQDILPAESAKWQYVEGFAREIFKRYNYAEVRTPIFEHYEVISRSVGDTTDIVTKEMYDFMTRVTAILPSVQKELRPLSVPMWKINSSPQKCKSQASSTIWDLCSVMSVHRQGACANSTRLVLSVLALAIQLPMWKQSLWQPIF